MKNRVKSDGRRGVRRMICCENDAALIWIDNPARPLIEFSRIDWRLLAPLNEQGIGIIKQRSERHTLPTQAMSLSADIFNQFGERRLP